MNPPHVDFDLIKVTQILDIPGIRNRIKNTTMKIINSMFLYPNAYSINLSKGVNVSKLAVFRTEVRTTSVFLVLVVPCREFCESM